MQTLWFQPGWYLMTHRRKYLDNIEPFTSHSSPSEPSSHLNTVIRKLIEVSQGTTAKNIGVSEKKIRYESIKLNPAPP